MADDSNHSNGILFKPLIGVTNRSDDLSLQVGHSANIVQDGEIRDVVEKAVDRDIPAQSIICRRPKAVCSNDLPVFCLDFLKLRSTPKSGYLDDLSPFEKDVHQPESATDHPAVLEEGVHFVRVGIGGHIKIFWRLSQKKVPNASADEISKESVPMETVKDF